MTTEQLMMKEIRKKKLFFKVVVRFENRKNQLKKKFIDILVQNIVN